MFGEFVSRISDAGAREMLREFILQDDRFQRIPTKDAAEHIAEDLPFYVAPGFLLDVWMGVYKNQMTGEGKSDTMDAKGDVIMKKFEVNFTDARTGATSPIDTIVAGDDYTPQQYLEDCENNGVEWGDGKIFFTEIEEMEVVFTGYDSCGRVTAGIDSTGRIYVVHDGKSEQYPWNEERYESDFDFRLMFLREGFRTE